MNPHVGSWDGMVILAKVFGCVKMMPLAALLCE